jgi:Ca2+-binding EF-hand superfamily protein
VCVEATVSDDEDPDHIHLARTPENVNIDLFDLALTVVPGVRRALAEIRSDELLKQFFKFDQDGSGKLSQKEIQEVAREMGLDPREMETEGHDNVDFETFQDMIVRGAERQERTCRERERHVQSIAGLSEASFQKFRKDLVQLYDVFVRYDVDNTKCLSKAELLFMLQESGLAPRSTAEKADMSAIFSVDTSGGQAEQEIRFGDFLEIVWEIRHYRQEKAKDRQLERFHRYDRDKSGSLTFRELSRVLDDLHLTPMNRSEQEEISNLISAVDLDGSGYIDFSEFQELSQRIDEKLRSFRFEEEIEHAMRLGFTEVQMRDLRQVFSSLDADASQKLDADEVRIGLAMMNKNVTHRIFDETFRKLDSDGSGELDFMEFLEFMKMIVDQQGPMGNLSEGSTKLAQKPKDLETRILRRVLEYFRLAKHYIQSLPRDDLLSLFCEYLGVKPDQNLQNVLEVKTVGELYEVAQERDLAMQQDVS